MTDIKICVRYVRNAIIAPGCISPALIRSEPNHTTATLEILIINVAVGNINACRRPPRSATSVTAAFASLKRFFSSGSRTNARTIRIPVSCSRRISLMRSIRSCILRNDGTMLPIMRPSNTARIGMENIKMRDKPRSCCMARITPPIEVNGALSNNVQVINTNICTCCTSFVMRVISEGAPNCATSRAEKSLT